ncbi:ATP-binding protein [Bacillus sp. Marseille-Q1617]|uniref:ATP-binding protein n=1 Tax=Bacillus sp. Marseille-Q1617 TaxID=2736887 RepID=UPI00158D1067|nr:ATP-binding protein [Bacillus sp. Marseille-Q1617]
MHLVSSTNKPRLFHEEDSPYKRLIDNHPDGILIHEKGTIIYVNPVALSYVGYEEKEVLGKTLLDFTPASSHHKILRREKEIYSSSQEIMYELTEYELTTKKGEPFFVESKAISCKFDGKRCVQLVLRDINRRKKQEEYMRASDRLAAAGQMAAGIAHEIRNPLTSIRGFVQMLRESPKSSHFYEVILNEIDRINQVTNDFLVLAKPHGKNLITHNINELIKEVIHLMQPEAAANNVKCDLSVSEQDGFILCDKNELKQVFINLIKNAIEAMPAGGLITINVSKYQHTLTVMVKDTGIGIPKDILAYIGQPFYTLKEKGTGLGIMTTMKIIDDHKGNFKIDSIENSGTTITVTFPSAHHPGFGRLSGSG